MISASVPEKKGNSSTLTISRGKKQYNLKSKILLAVCLFAMNGDIRNYIESKNNWEPRSFFNPGMTAILVRKNIKNRERSWAVLSPVRSEGTLPIIIFGGGGGGDDVFSFVARPDGKILHQLKRNVTGILISKIDPNSQYVDPSGPWRDRAYKGILHSGRL